MAFGSRNSVLTLFLSVGICLAVVCAAAGIVIIVSLAGDGRINFFESHPFWFSYDISPVGEIVNAAGIVLLFALGLGALNCYRILFKRMAQAEIFFFALFLFSLVPETLRLAVLALQLLEAPPVLGLILSRVVYGSRVFGLFALFFGSLYALDLQYQKFEVAVAVMLGFSLFLTFVIPFDSQLLLTNGLYKVSDEQGLFIIYYSLMLLLCVNYIIAMIRGRGFLMPLGMLLLLVGREVLVFTLSPVTLGLGAAVCLTGIILAYRGFESTFNLA
jgi:hypothetical protein